MNPLAGDRTPRESAWEQGVRAIHLLDRPDLSVDRLVIEPGASMKAHTHSRTRQYFFVLRGEATLTIGAKPVTVHEGEGVEVPPRLRHSVRNDSPEEIEILLSSSPRPTGARAERPRPLQRDRGGVVLSSYARRTRFGDLEAVVDIEEALDTRRWIGEGGMAWHTQVLEDRSMEHWVLVDRFDRILAFGILSGVGAPGHVEIRRMVVSPEGRGQGLGRILLRHLLEHARARPSVARVWLEVGADNTRARSLYRSFGFVEKEPPPWATMLQDGVYMEYNAEGA